MLTQGTLTVLVDLVDHVHELLLGGILTQTPHDHSQLLAVDVSAVVLVKQLERLANFCTCPARQLKTVYRKTKKSIQYWMEIAISSN